MSRPLRLDAPGEFFHVMARGNARAPIYLDDEDRSSFLEILADVVDTLGIACHAYCLMDNHYHLILQPNTSSLSKAMQRLNGRFSDRLNRRHRRTEHVFEGRFKSLLIDRDVYLQELSRYVVLNPVRARLVSSPEEWPWSSYRAMTGIVPTPKFLSESVVLRPMGGCVGDAARRAFAEFVAAGMADDALARRLAAVIDRGAIAGREVFAKRFESQVVAAQACADIPLAQRRITRPSLARLLSGRRTLADLRGAILVAHVRHGYEIDEIAASALLSRSTVSRIVRQGRRGLPPPLFEPPSLEE